MNVKGLTVLLLTFVIVFNFFFPPIISHAMTDSNKFKIEKLVERGIIEGDVNGNIKLKNSIKRSEITKIIVYALGHKDEADRLQFEVSSFSDLPQDHWANGVVGLATSLKMPNGNVFINGYSDGSFRPEANINNAELLKILVVILKDDLSPKQASSVKWPNDYIKWARQEGIIGPNTGVNRLDPYKEATRETVFVCLYNTLEKLEFKRAEKLRKAKEELRKGKRPVGPEYSGDKFPIDGH